MTLNRLAAWASSVVVGVSVAFGVWISGAPQTQRLERLDEMRVSSLRNLADVIDGYWRASGALPATLTDVVDGLRLSGVPVDPVTGLPYEYTLVALDRFALCADFALASEPDSEDTFWMHAAGRDCFEFEVREPVSPRADP